MTKPNVYILGAKPKLKLTTEDEDGILFEPAYARISIKQPDGDIITVSGGSAVPGDLVVGSGYLYYLYKPPTIGWYEYEAWGADANLGQPEGLEDSDTNGFEVTDRVFP